MILLKDIAGWIHLTALILTFITAYLVFFVWGRR